MTPEDRAHLRRLLDATQRARGHLFEAKPNLHRLGEADLKLAMLAHLADAAQCAVNALVWALTAVLAEGETT